MDKREFIKLLNEYFLGLIHYQYSINNGEKNAVKEYKIQDKYLQDKLWKKIQELIHSERPKWNKEMREMIGEDEGEKKELDNIDKAFGVTGFTVVNDKQMIRNQFRHQLLEQLEEKK